MLLEKG
ncbi:hypothetical protein ZEAMMB73_Zm00001d013852 [Zea mays]|nr:hypothetical protein ZEAMMB73_Zm00001d013852 [Zea mays]AQK64576.1 hypothetical protein ZEAMMB73_Zm00001d013852 [Zea mays]